MISNSEESSMRGLDKFYHDNYRRLLIIPFLMLIIAFCVLGYNYTTTGALIGMGVSLSGGITVTVPTIHGAVDVMGVEATLKNALPGKDLAVREIAEFGVQQAVTIQAAATESDNLEELEENIVAALEPSIPTIREEYAVEIIGPSLGQSFLTQTLIALAASFALMALVVFFIFRTFVPSAAVVLAAFSDMVVTLAVISLLDIKLGTAGIAAFLMLIGYSVDTDILLSTRVLRGKEGTVYDRIKSAIGTGLLMNITTLVAITVALIITQSEIIAQIMTILLVGLLVDIINTWIQNAGILRWYAEKKN